jgi:hypothetical protein
MVDKVEVRTPDSAKLIQTKITHQNESPLNGRGIGEGPNTNSMRFELQNMDDGIGPDEYLDEYGKRQRPIGQVAKVQVTRAQGTKGSPSNVSPKKTKKSKPRKDLGNHMPIYVQGDGFERRSVQNQNTNAQFLQEVRNFESEVVGVNKN